MPMRSAKRGKVLGDMRLLVPGLTREATVAELLQLKVSASSTKRISRVTET